MLDAAPDTFEGFAAAVRGAIEDQAQRHADDRWWILEPTLLIQRRDGRVDALELTAEPADGRTGRAVARTPLPQLPKALDARRAAVALHVDLLVGDEPFAAIVLAVAGALAASYQQARVERTDTGTPRLGPWEPAPELAAEVEDAVRRALTRAAGA